MSARSRVEKLEALRMAGAGALIFCPPIMTVDEWEASLRGEILPSYALKTNPDGETFAEHYQRLGLAELASPRRTV